MTKQYVVVYLWQGERHRTFPMNHKTAHTTVLQLIAQQMTAWIETV